jgi:hypothetical protein
MFDHIGFNVSNFSRSKAFYARALAPLGISIVREATAEQTGGYAHVVFGVPGRPFFWIGMGRALTRRLHVALPRANAARSMPSIMRRLRPAAPTTARPACDRIITLIITGRLCLSRTGTTSRRCASGRGNWDPKRSAHAKLSAFVLGFR